MLNTKSKSGVGTITSASISVCRQAFDEGRAKRLKFPLHNGAYKLREALRGLDGCLETLDAIATDRKQGLTGLARPLGCCTSDDYAVWLQRLPESIAFDLGYYTLPAIVALRGDGVPSAALNRTLAEAEHEVRKLVVACEATRLTLQQGIALEYKRMEAGKSALRKLAQRAAQIAQSGLDLASIYS